MSIATQDVLFGVAGQSLVLEVDRPLTSVTSVSVHEMDADDSSALSATTGVAAVDTATEATTAAAGPATSDPRKLTVASTTGFVVGRRYWLSGGGKSESFEVEEVNSNASIYTRHPLWNDYITGATLAGTLRATISVLDAWAVASGNVSPSANPNARYRVRWVVVHSDTSETAIYYRNLDLTRYGAIPTVSPLDVDDAMPGWLDSLPPDHQDSRGRKLIIEATRAVRLDLYRHGRADQALRNAEVFAELVIAKVLFLTMRANALHGAVEPARLEIAKLAYDERIAGLVESPVLAVDAAGGGAATTATGRATPLWVR